MQEMEGKGKGELLVLREDLFLGHGVHKAAYIDPRDPSRCVKIVFRMPDYDLMKELGYRRSRRRRGLSSELLPAYYGTVETNKGMGYVFERVVDYDGQPSKTLAEVFSGSTGQDMRFPDTEHILSRLREMLFRERVIMRDTECGNIMLQRLSEDGGFTVRIVDNLGTHAHIPIVYYVDYFAAKHVKKYWHRLLDRIRRKYPDVLQEELKQRLW